MNKINIAHDGKTPLSVLYAEAKNLIKAGYEIIKPRKSKLTILTTGNLFGRKRKEKEIITTATVMTKERADEKVISITTGSKRKKKEESDSPFQWSKGNWR